MRKRQQNNPYKKEISDMAKGLKDNQSILLDGESITSAKPVKIPFPYGRVRPKPFGWDGRFGGWIPRGGRFK